MGDRTFFGILILLCVAWLGLTVSHADSSSQGNRPPLVVVDLQSVACTASTTITGSSFTADRACNAIVAFTPTSAAASTTVSVFEDDGTDTEEHRLNVGTASTVPHAYTWVVPVTTGKTYTMQTGSSCGAAIKVVLVFNGEI